MGKIKVYDEIKTTLEIALRGPQNISDLPPIDRIHNTEILFNASLSQLETIRKLNNSARIYAYFHQGRALRMNNNLKKRLTRFHTMIAQNVYELFKSHDKWIYSFYCRPEALPTLTPQEIRQLRELILQKDSGTEPSEEGTDVAWVLNVEQ